MLVKSIILALICLPSVESVCSAHNIVFLVFYFLDKPFVGASVGYFSFLFLLAGRALTVSYSFNSSTL